MTTPIRTLALLLLLALPTTAAQQGIQDELLDHLAGHWLMTGTIAGGQVSHDLDAEWVLGHQYLRFHELARELDEDGNPAYEAIVFIGWNQTLGQYTCLWLDVTGSGAQFPEGTGYAEPAPDKLAFVFDDGGDSAIHTTFTYDREADVWHWLIDIVRGTEHSTFASVSLARR